MAIIGDQGGLLRAEEAIASPGTRLIMQLRIRMGTGLVARSLKTRLSLEPIN